MSKTKILISLVLLTIITFMVFKFIKYRSKKDIIVQESTNNFLIIYQSKRVGVTTQNTCSFAPYGGIKREMNKVNLLKAIYKDNSLYIDAGNSLAPLDPAERATTEQQETNKESAMSIAKKLVEIKIDALGVGAAEMTLGIPYLKEIERKTSIPFVSSNIKYKNNNKYPFDRYILKTLRDIKFAIISLTDSEFIEDNSIEILNPKQVINELVPSLKKDSDFIILLSQLPTNEIESIVSELNAESSIQIILDSDVRSIDGSIAWLNQGKTLLANQYARGHYLGELEIDYKKPFVAFSSDTVLKKNVDKLNQIQKVIDDKNTPEGRKKALKKSVERINRTLQVKEIPGATTYSGRIIGLDPSYDY